MNQLISLTSKDGKKVTYNGKSVKIFTALYDLYENHNVNCAKINDRTVWFDNTSWTFEDEIPSQVKERVMDKYYRDSERMFYSGNIIQC